MRIIAIVGRSGAGKTTLVDELIVELRRRKRTAAVIKHCGKGFDLGGAGKDSSRFLEAGAISVTLSGPDGTAMLRTWRKRPKDRELAASLPAADFLLIEGGRVEAGIPKIEVLGSNPRDRIPMPAKDRIAIVARGRVPAAPLTPVFGPDEIRPIADLIEAGGESDFGVSLQRAEALFFARHDPGILSPLRRSVVGIAGAGGLGSNVALALTRAGVGKLIIADFDRIEPANLNRQQYFSDQIGRYKVDALAENLRRIHPFTAIAARRIRLTAKNVGTVFSEAHLLIEAFDRADQKQMVIETWMAVFPDRPIIAASGLSGYGGNNKIRERKIGRLYLIGDEASEPAPGISPMAPRVAAVAALQANRAVACLVRLLRSSGVSGSSKPVHPPE